MITKDGRDTAIEKITPENYIVPKGEEKDYHALIEVVQFDPKTGRKLSKARIQKFGRKTFERGVEANLRKQGYSIVILHNPNQWLKEKAEKEAKQAKLKAEQKAKAEQEKFDAAVKAAVAKALAEKAAKEKAKVKAETETETESEAEKRKPGRPAKTEVSDKTE